MEGVIEIWWGSSDLPLSSLSVRERSQSTCQIWGVPWKSCNYSEADDHSYAQRTVLGINWNKCLRSYSYVVFIQVWKSDGCNAASVLYSEESPKAFLMYKHWEEFIKVREATSPHLNLLCAFLCDHYHHSHNTHRVMLTIFKDVHLFKTCFTKRFNHAPGQLNY